MQQDVSDKTQKKINTAPYSQLPNVQMYSREGKKKCFLKGLLQSVSTMLEHQP